MDTDQTHNSVTPHLGVESKPIFRNLTPLAKRALIIASVSALIAGAASIAGTAEPGHRAFGLWMFPHLIVVALLSMGLRVLGDITAVIVSVIVFFLGLLLGMLGGHSAYGGLAPNGPAFLLAILQVPLLVTAITDLAKNRGMKSQPLQLVHCALGLGLPLGLYLIVWAMSAAGAN